MTMIDLSKLKHTEQQDGNSRLQGSWVSKLEFERRWDETILGQVYHH